MDGREGAVSRTFVALADTLVSDFDALEFFALLGEACVELMEVSAVGVILIDERGGLEVAAASSERTRLLELFAVAIDDGPCVQCVRTGLPVISGDLTTDATRGRWPRFAAGAAEAGFVSMHAFPMRLRDQVIGVLNLLHTEPYDLDADDSALAQALADVATIGLLQQRAVHRAQNLSEQLQGALNSRVIVEQAKGMLAREGGTSPDEAYVALRRHARNRGLHLTDLARDVVDRRLTLKGLTPGAT